MPALPNPRHERFAQELAKGLGQTEAYVAAGYKENRSAASRLADDVNVCERVSEIQERGAIRAEITVAGLTEELQSLAAMAKDMESESGVQAARACLMDAAKLNGLVVDKSVQAQSSVEDVLERIHNRRAAARDLH